MLVSLDCSFCLTFCDLSFGQIFFLASPYSWSTSSYERVSIYFFGFEWSDYLSSLKLQFYMQLDRISNTTSDLGTKIVHSLTVVIKTDLSIVL